MAASDLKSRQCDAVSAFKNNSIKEPIYYKPLEEWTGSGMTLSFLLQALCGLNQSPALWYRQFLQTLIELGLVPVTGVECLFMNDFKRLFFFVDNTVIPFPRQYVKQVVGFQVRVFEAYGIRYLGEVKWFLGIRLVKDRDTRHRWLCQDSYIDKITSKLNISTETKSPGTPLLCEELTRSTTQATPQDIYAYQHRVGSINFAAVITRPDIAQGASKFSQSARYKPIKPPPRMRK